MARDFPKDAGANCQAAGAVACCVPLAADDQALSEAKRKEQAQSYASQAVDLLRQAGRLGFRDARHLRTEAAFAPLRGRADFQALLREIEASPKTSDH
jgi:hypothetical protein